MNKLKLISTILFLVIGLVFGAVFIYSLGWSFKEFITDPTTLLIILIGLCGLVFWWTFK